MTVSIALRYSFIRCLDNVGETIFNLLHLDVQVQVTPLGWRVPW